MVTSAITGKTRIWRTPLDSSYLGNDRALAIVQSEAGLGINWNNYNPVEPREVFPPHQGLQFLVSIIPANQAARVTLNVIVDAKSQSVVGVFQADAQGDADLVNYLNTGVLPASEQFDGAGAGNNTGLTSTPEQNPGAASTTPVTSTPTATLPGASVPATGDVTGADAVSTLKRLLAENVAAQTANANQLAQLKAQQVDLQRLLTLAESKKK